MGAAADRIKDSGIETTGGVKKPLAIRQPQIRPPMVTLHVPFNPTHTSSRTRKSATSSPQKIYPPLRARRAAHPHTSASALKPDAISSMQDPLQVALSSFVRAAADAGYLVNTIALTRPDRPSPPQWPIVSVNGQIVRFQQYYVQPYYQQYPAQPFWNTVLSPPDPKPQPKEFACPRCHATFKTNSNMQKHVRTVHENARPFKCDQCDAAYGHKNLLVEHVRTRHNGERPFECTTCGARFGRSSNLYSHMKSHDGKREHVCATCHVSFSLYGNMVKHIKTVHLKQRPFECDTCGSRFGLRSDLTRHCRNVHGVVDKRRLDGAGSSKERGNGQERSSRADNSEPPEKRLAGAG